MANNYLLATKAERVKIGALSEVADSLQRVLENVAAVDFGTTFCSVAFKLKNTPGKFIENIELEPGHKRSPTAILLQRCGEQLYSVADFGACAQEKVTTLLRTELQTVYLYFELFKMELRSHVSMHARRLYSHTLSDFRIRGIVIHVASSPGSSPLAY